jgi:putative ABC transport system permease protein
VSSIVQDVRYSLRLLARNPNFTVFATLTLAVALGVNTAVFSIMYNVLLRALPYPESHRIVDVSVLLPPSEGRPSRKDYLDIQTFESWRQTARTVEHLAGYRKRPLTLSGAGAPERMIGANVSPELFSLLRATPAQGRSFREEEERPGFDRVVILSDGLWRRRFQEDPAIIGKTVTLDGLPHTVVGVTPRNFFFPDHEVKLWVPLTVEARAPSASGVIRTEYFPVVARLRSGISAKQAEAEVQAIFHDRGAAEGAGLPGRVRISPLRDEMVAGVRPALLSLFAGVALVLLIACINLSNLLLARSSSRQREMALRSAVGGSRGRLVRQVLTESTLLSLLGGAAGLLLAAWLHLALPRLLPPDLPRMEEIHIDARVFLFAFLLSVLSGLLSGLVPAWRSSGKYLILPLQGGTAASPKLRSLSLFVVAQVALAFVLSVGAGLLLRSFTSLVRVELGYEPSHVLTAVLDLDPAKYGAPGRAEAFFDAFLNRLAKNPEVKAAGLVSFPPLPKEFSLTGVKILSQAPRRTMAVPQLSSPGYLQAMGMRLSSGRWLMEQDLTAKAPVAVINKTFARRYIVGPEAIGRRLEVGSVPLEIVGVIEDVRLLGQTKEPMPELFTTYRNTGKVSGANLERLTLAIRTTGNPSALVPFLRATAMALDPNLPLEDVQTMESRVAASVAQPRFYAWLLGAFAGMALVLASAGVYSVLSYAVARQTRAIGVRRALGAREKAILSMVLGKAARLVFTGLAVGMAAALVATQALAQLLFSGVTPRDPLSYSVAALLLVGTTFFACYLPARHAIRVQPIAALRYDG